MHLFKKHFKFNDSWMWCDWVAHNGFGRPRLGVNCIRQGLKFYFIFTCYKFQWYWVKPHKYLLRRTDDGKDEQASSKKDFGRSLHLPRV